MINKLKWIQTLQNQLTQTIQKEASKFAEAQNLEIIETPKGADLVMGENLEDIYGNHFHPREKFWDLDVLRKNILHHFERVYSNGRLHLMGHAKENSNRTSAK